MAASESERTPITVHRSVDLKRLANTGINWNVETQKQGGQRIRLQSSSSSSTINKERRQPTRKFLFGNTKQ